MVDKVAVDVGSSLGAKSDGQFTLKQKIRFRLLVVVVVAAAAATCYITGVTEQLKVIPRARSRQLCSLLPSILGTPFFPFLRLSYFKLFSISVSCIR